MGRCEEGHRQIKKGGEEERLEKEDAEDALKAHHQPAISIHTITLPPKAPRDLLIALKQIFETFPGSEKVQLNIGGKIVPVPMTITVSPVLDKKVEEAVGKYS
jgi:hypothetical protein